MKHFLCSKVNGSCLLYNPKYTSCSLDMVFGSYNKYCHHCCFQMTQSIDKMHFKAMIHIVFCCFENLMHCMALCSSIFNWQFIKLQVTNGGHQRAQKKISGGHHDKNGSSEATCLWQK